MRRGLLPAVIATIAVAGCSSPTPPKAEKGSPLPAASVVRQPAPVETWFDADTARKIMIARANFDEGEAAILAESDRIYGAYRDVMLLSHDAYARHLAGEIVRVPHSAAWLREQRRRSAYAAFVRKPKYDALRAGFERETVAALSAFFTAELRARRISKRDYARYTVEIRSGYFPGFRPRKWSGPPVYGFRGVTVSREYQKILQEVRRLWQALSRNTSAVTSMATNPEFYRSLVPETTPNRRPVLQ
jgi:hypothetical protein